MGSYRVTASRIAYDGVFSRVRVDEVAMPDGDVAHREIVEHTDAVAAVPLDGEGSVVLVRQYRHAFGERFLELPAGKLDVEGEDPAAAMHRELAEEAGLSAGRLEPLLRFHNSAGWTDEATHLYLATELGAEGRPEQFVARHEEAEIEVSRVPLAEAVRAVHRGEITDAKTALGLLLVASRLHSVDFS